MMQKDDAQAREGRENVYHAPLDKSLDVSFSRPRARAFYVTAMDCACVYRYNVWCTVSACGGLCLFRNGMSIANCSVINSFTDGWTGIQCEIIFYQFSFALCTRSVSKLYLFCKEYTYYNN